MTGQHGEDGERVALERRTSRLRRVGVALAAAGACLTGATAVIGSVLGERWTSVAFMTAALLVLAALILLTMTRRTPAPLPGQTRRDRMQRERTAGFLLAPVSALIFVSMSLRSAEDVVDGVATFTDWAFLLMPILLCVLPLSAAGVGWAGRPEIRKYLEDEFTQSLRARAFQVGYFGLLAGAVGLYLLVVFRPEWAIYAAPALLAPGAILPAFWFAVLDRRADADA